MWEHSSPSRDKSSDALASVFSADPDAAPLLVQQLAASQLRSLREGVSQASSALAAAAEAEELPEVVVVADGRPSRIPTSELPLPSPTQSPRRQLKTSSSNESDLVRNLNDTSKAEKDTIL